jgi:hypothetical protein
VDQADRPIDHRPGPRGGLTEYGSCHDDSRPDHDDSRSDHAAADDASAIDHRWSSSIRNQTVTIASTMHVCCSSLFYALQDCAQD